MNGSWHNLDRVGADPGVFGDDQQFAQNLTPAGSTSLVFASFLSFVTPIVPAGTYRLGIVFQYEGSAGSTVGEYQLLVDGAPVDIETLNVASAAERKTYANFGQVVLGVAAAHTIDMQFRRSAGAGTFTVDDAKIELWRVV